MKLVFTPSGGSAATLGDDAAKYVVTIEQLGGASVADIVPLVGAPMPAAFPRGNVGGDFVFRSAKSYADYKTTFTQFATEYGRLNQQGSLVLTESTVTLTFADAILKGVQRLFDGQAGGTHMAIRYTFAIRTIA